MNRSEGDYITLCKRLIEEKLNLNNERSTLRQRDLEYLADHIEEKSGIKLSLSTIKRLWKKDYDQTPHPSTLQALVSVLGYKDWQDFKLRASVPPPAVFSATQVRPQPARASYRWLIISGMIAVPVLIWLIAFRSGREEKSKPIVTGPVTFTGNKTVSKGVPSTIIFTYDLSNVEADSFFFQQSWNPLEKVKLDPKGKHYSNIYYYPGFHKAKLIANDSILKRFRIHITTDGWMALFRNSYSDNTPVYIKNIDLVSGGALHVKPDNLNSSNANAGSPRVLSYYNVREFANTNSDRFFLDTKIKCDSISTVACPGFEVVIICEEHLFYVRMMGRGCERDIGIKMGEVIHDGGSSDLSAFGRDLYQWQHLQIEVKNKHAKIYLDGQPVYATSFKNDFGKVVGLVYNFIGTGAVDQVTLKNSEDKIVYEDDFKK